MITPTPGRVVWFRPDLQAAEAGFARPFDGQPLAAIVAYVHSDRTVNLCVYDVNGVPHPRARVPLRQSEDPVPGSGSYCEWMPYQMGQAARAEAAEAAGAVAAGSMGGRG